MGFSSREIIENTTEEKFMLNMKNTLRHRAKLFSLETRMLLPTLRRYSYSQLSICSYLQLLDQLAIPVQLQDSVATYSQLQLASHCQYFFQPSCYTACTKAMELSALRPYAGIYIGSYRLVKTFAVPRLYIHSRKKFAVINFLAVIVFT